MSLSVVEVFNQLTRKELADYSLASLEELLGDHYEKFILFYNGCKSTPKDTMKSMKYVSCSTNDKGILIELELKSKKQCENYKEAIDESMSSAKYCTEGYLKHSVEIIGSKKINISIENDSISGEDEIYENKFN